MVGTEVLDHAGNLSCLVKRDRVLMPYGHQTGPHFNVLFEFIV